MRNRVIVRLTNDESDLLMELSIRQHRERAEQAGYMLGELLRAELAAAENRSTLAPAEMVGLGHPGAPQP